jgi:ribonuclease R
MIPHTLSSGICSLVEGEERLVQSVGIDYTPDSEVAGVRFADGVIRSTARLTYPEAAEAMEDPERFGRSGEAGHRTAMLLSLLAPLARRLTEKRRERGALDLELPEVEIDRGKEGHSTEIRAHERTDAHRLIEEFMLAANEAVARKLSAWKSRGLYRVHEPPDPADIDKVEEDLRELGIRRSRGGDPARRLQKILSRFAGGPEEAIIGKFVLKAMKLARYAAARAGHFGLALDHYTHFTSPIRRYPDLVVHRLLRTALRSPPGDGDGETGGRIPTLDRLEEIAAESSRLERRAEGAERAVEDLLVARNLTSRIGSVYEGRVSGSSRNGVFVMLEGGGLPRGVAEGFARVARRAGYVLTEPVRARLEEVDQLRGHLRLELVGD